MNNIGVRLARKDLLMALRDPLLMFIAFLPFLLGFIFRFLLPFAAELAEPYFDLTEYYSYIVIMLAMMGPVMYGWITAFTFLEEKDRSLFPPLMVTPVPPALILSIKPAIAFLLSLPGLAVIVPLTGVPLLINGLHLFSLLLMTALEGPLISLFMICLSKNRVQGLTMGKLVSFFLMLPIIAFLFDLPFLNLLAFIPSWWLFFGVSQSDSVVLLFLSFAGGILVHCAYIGILFRAAMRKLV